jgi:phosphoglycerol transferase
MQPDLLHNLSVLNIFAVLLGTVGGFGFLFAVVISNSIRSYTRISTFTAFFSLLAIALALEQIYQRMAKKRAIFYVLIAVLLVGGILDQTTRAYVPDYRGTKTDYLSDEEFVQKVEASVPAGSMIFQLPYVPFPEHPKVHEMVDYDHFRAYLHSRNLRWSYGTIKKRDGDLAQQRVAALRGEEFTQALAFAGFSGVYLDRHGYEDGGAAKVAELTNVLQTTPIVSPNGRLLFFNLADYTQRLRAKYSESEWQAKQESSFHPLLLEWKGGFSGLETEGAMNWHWSSSESELHLRNTSERPRKIKIEMSFATGHEQMDDLVLSGLISEALKVSSRPSLYSKELEVPPGESVIWFKCSAPRVNAPRDPRVLVFRVENFKLTELE